MRGLLAAAALLLWAGAAEGATLRYGVVVGSNIGNDIGSGLLPELRFAEVEARRLHEKLVQSCNFGPEKARSVLLIRPTRSELEAAIARIAAQIELDRTALGDTDALFAFFFTGHGTDGHILLADGPMASTELAHLLRSVPAKLMFGVFDACYSASLAPEGLLEKGVRPAPGNNVFKELPEEMLEAEGAIWFLSSGPDEASYEDSQVGGLFTHYFIEALDRAAPEGPGVALDQIWSYARARTQAHAQARNRSQNPRRIVAHMKERGALLFSFPGTRDATLVLGDSLTGHFLLSYADGQLVERIEKTETGRKVLAVFSGRARLRRIGSAGNVAGDVELRPGDELVLAGLDDSLAVGLGRTPTELWSKGELGLVLAANQVSDRSWYGGVAGGTAWCARACQQPSWTLGPSLRWDSGAWSSAASLQFGQRSESYPAWGYQILGGLVRFQSGYAIEPGDGWRAALRLGLSGGVFRQEYSDEVIQRSWLVRPDLGVNLAYSITDSIAVEVDLGLGLVVAPGAAAGAPLEARPSGMLGVGLLHRLALGL